MQSNYFKSKISQPSITPLPSININFKCPKCQAFLESRLPELSGRKKFWEFFQIITRCPYCQQGYEIHGHQGLSKYYVRVSESFINTMIAKGL